MSGEKTTHDFDCLIRFCRRCGVTIEEHEDDPQPCPNPIGITSLRYWTALKQAQGIVASIVYPDEFWTITP